MKFSFSNKIVFFFKLNLKFFDFFLFRYRCRSRAEQLDGIGIQSHVMDINRHHRNPLPPPPPNAVHLVNENGQVEQWSKLADHQNGHEVR